MQLSLEMLIILSLNQKKIVQWTRRTHYGIPIKYNVSIVVIHDVQNVVFGVWLYIRMKVVCSQILGVITILLHCQIGECM